jgi:hypothetical protein
MDEYRVRRVVQIAFFLVVIVIVVVALGFGIRAVFFPNSTPSTPDTSESSLLSTSANRAVSVKVRGPIVADENFRSYQIQITPNSRVLTEYKGYENQEFDNITLNNNIPSYEQFVYALDHDNMVSGSELTGTANDTRGVCPTGKLYEFQTLKANKTTKMLWTASCSNVSGSLSANLSSLNDLFIDQIPGAQTKIDKLWQLTQ